MNSNFGLGGNWFKKKKISTKKCDHDLYNGKDIAVVLHHHHHHPTEGCARRLVK